MDAATAQEAPRKLTNEELAILANGTDKKAVLKDIEGKEHTLFPLNLADMVEFETNLNTPITEFVQSPVKLRWMQFLLYLSLRKEGCSKEDLEKRRYRYTERQIGEMFDLGILVSYYEILQDLLTISGFKAAGNPQTPASQKDGTQGNVAEKA